MFFISFDRPMDYANVCMPQTGGGEIPMDRSGFAYQAKINAKRDLYIVMITCEYDDFTAVVNRFVGNAEATRDHVRIYARQYFESDYRWSCNPVKGK